MWKIAGSLELLQFFLYVPLSYENFCIFHDVFGRQGVWAETDMTRNELLISAVKRVRQEQQADGAGASAGFSC